MQLLLSLLVAVSMAAPAQGVRPAETVLTPDVRDQPVLTDDGGDKPITLDVDISGAATLSDLPQEFLEINRHVADADLSEREAQRQLGLHPARLNRC